VAAILFDELACLADYVSRLPVGFSFVADVTERDKHRGINYPLLRLHSRGQPASFVGPVVNLSSRPALSSHNRLPLRIGGSLNHGKRTVASRLVHFINSDSPKANIPLAFTYGQSSTWWSGRSESA
jgi:hypothetical protein